MWDTRYFAERGYGCKWCFQKSQILCIEDHVGTIIRSLYEAQTTIP